MKILKTRESNEEQASLGGPVSHLLAGQVNPRVVRIHCYAPESLRLSEATLAAWGAAFDAEFVPLDPGADASAGPLLVFGDGHDVPLKLSQARHILFISTEAGSPGVSIDEIEVCGRLPGKPWLQGHKLSLPQTTRVVPLSGLPAGAEIMARCKAGPVWVRERAGERMADRVAWSIQPPGAEQAVFEWFNARTFALWLPVAQFVREVTGGHRWNTPIKACFMFDDPNLHARSYGYIHYSELAEHCHQVGYHVSFATIPLDGWFVSSRAAALFREHKDQLSLLVHGNDHVYREFARPYRYGDRHALLAQALRRIQQLEVRSGVKVCRVMVAPHGACSEDMMGPLARFGFEAASISHSSLRAHNSGRAWTRSLGSHPAECIAGLPIVPRFQMAADNFQTVLFSAYLDQPIIPMGHHQDVAPGLNLLDSLADQINRLGPVQWSSMSGMVRSHFQWRHSAETMVVRPFSTLLKISIPEGIMRLRVDPHHGSHFDRPDYSISSSLQGAFLDFNANEGVAVTGGTTVWLKPAFQKILDPEKMLMPGFKLLQLARRLACEARDRTAPWLRRG